MPGDVAVSSESSVDAYQVLFSVGLDDKGVHYWQEPGQQRWGPSALAVADDGSIWIADAVANRLLHYSATGEQLGVVDLSGRIDGIGDVDASSGMLAVLDIAAMPPVVLVIDAASGKELKAVTVPNGFDLGAGLSGVAFGSRGEVLVELEGGARVGELVDGDGGTHTELIQGYPVGDRLFSIDIDDSPGRSSATISFGDLQMQVSVNQSLGGVYLLGASGESFTIAVDELGQDADGSIVVDRTVHRYAVRGEQESLGRVPLSEGYVHVTNGLDITPTGEVLALLPRSDRVDVVAVTLEPTDLPPILPSETAFQPQTPPTVPLACRSESQMLGVYADYIANMKYLNNTNINGSCSGRTKPRYLGSPGNYASVPYDWAGWDRAAQFNSKMDNNQQAGDITSAGVATCSRGTDCSGYISRLWNLPDKHDTCGLLHESYAISLSNMLQFDIFDICGDHTAAYHASGSGYYISDSTTENSIDRVTYRWVSSSWINGYQTRRYNNRCT